MIHSLQIEKTMTKTVVVKRKAKRAGIGVNWCEYLRMNITSQSQSEMF